MRCPACNQMVHAAWCPHFKAIMGTGTALKAEGPPDIGLIPPIETPFRDALHSLINREAPPPLLWTATATEGTLAEEGSIILQPGLDADRRNKSSLGDTMTQQEFEAKAGKTVTAEDYDTINHVYTFHPSIDEVKGKQQIAELYNLGGMRLIRDMVPTASKAQTIESDINQKTHELETLREQLAALKKGEA